MNENYFIKIQGKANVPERVDIGHNYKLTADCSVTSESRIDNQDGSFDIIFKVEPVTVAIEKDNGEVIKAKDPRKNSQKLRNYLFKLYHDEGYVEDFDRVYDEVTYVVMSYMPSMLREAIKRLEDKK